MAENFKMNSLSGCCSMEKRFKCKVKGPRIPPRGGGGE